MQEYLSELPFPSPGDLPNPGVEPRSPALQADSLPLSYLGSTMWPGASLYFESLLQRKRVQRTYVGGKLTISNISPSLPLGF